MALLNQKAFERKLQNMSSTQDSVQTVSLWMIHHKKHAEDMVAVWLEQLKKASKADRRLVLFYLANDVLQNSRKKGKEFSNAFTKILRDAMQLLSDKTIKSSVQRVIGIWEERRLFDKDYLEALRSKLDSGGVPVLSKKPKEKVVEKEKDKEKEKEVKPPKQKRLPPADFKPSKLIDALKTLRNFEGELTLKESQLNSLRIDASDLESVRRQLKDRTGGRKFCEEYELATSKLEEFSETLRREQEERLDIIRALEDGEAFYDTSYGEVKVIVHAYKTFGNRLTSLKKKVDAKVNRLAQKAAEKAKTGPVSAPQASFLTSGLPDVGEGSASSTPSQTQPETDKSPEEDKPIDPTVDNIEVADMDIEDDSDSEKSETSEETSAEDPKSSNDQASNSTESSDSQTAQSTPQELENTPMISPAVSAAPAQPLAPNVDAIVPVQGTMLPSRPPMVAPQPAVGMVIRPFMGVQGVHFPGPAGQFRPGVPPMQPLPGLPQNALLQPSGTLPAPGQIPSQAQSFSQLPRPAGLLPNANAPIPGGMRPVQQFPLSGGFVRSQAPLPVAATTVPVPIQVTPNSIPANETSQGGGLLKGVVGMGSPDSEASAPSPVGSPELHLQDGDETPETTPAPLGDVDVNEKTGFETNESFFENPVINPTTSLGLDFSETPSATKAVSESTSSSSSTPSTSDQIRGEQQGAAYVKKDNGQKVTAVDILAQLLSRGRKLKETSVQDSHSAPMPVNPPDAIPVPASKASSENSEKPQSKPLITLIDSLFPKLSDSLKTLKEKEKAVNPPEAQFLPSSIQEVSTPPSLPARPLPIEGQYQRPSGVVEEPPFQQTGLKSILKKGPRKDEEQLEFGTDSASNFPEETPMGMPMHPELRDEIRSRPRQDQNLQHLEQQANQLGANEGASLPSPTSHLAQPGNQFENPPVRGNVPHVPQERPYNQPLSHGPRPFGPRGMFQGPRGPPLNHSRSSTGLPFGEGPPRMPGPPHIHSLRGPPFERIAEGQADIPGRVPTGQPHSHSPSGPPDMPEHLPPRGPPHIHPPRGPPFERIAEGPPDTSGRVPNDQPPHGHSPRGPPYKGAPDVPEQLPPHRPPPGHSPRGPPADMPERMASAQSPHGHSPRGSFKDCPPQGPADTSNIHRRSTAAPAPSPGGPSKPSDVPVEEKHLIKSDENSYVSNGPPGVRRISTEGASRGPLRRPDLRQPPLEHVPRNDGLPPHRASFPGAMDDVERPREFEHWEEYPRERPKDHVRGPWDAPFDHPGPPPPPNWRGPPVSPRGDPNRGDFREDDPSMWTSFESPGKSPGHHMDFPNRTHEGFREGPPDFERFRDYGPPFRRRHSAGDFESDWMRHPGPLKRPGPPPIPFPGPVKRFYY